MSKNCQKLDIFFKNCQKFSFFLEKNENFWQFFEKISSFWQFFDIQMAIFQRVRTCHILGPSLTALLLHCTVVLMLRASREAVERESERTHKTLAASVIWIMWIKSLIRWKNYNICWGNSLTFQTHNVRTHFCPFLQNEWEEMLRLWLELSSLNWKYLEGIQCSKGGRVGLKMGHFGPKWDTSVTF